MNLFIFSLTLAMLAAPLSAKESKGPYLRTQQRGETKITPAGEAKSDEESKMASHMTELQLLAPVPAKFLGGMVLLNANLMSETREFTGADSPLTSSDELKTPGRTALGFVYLKHAAEGAPHFIFAANRWGAIDPMAAAETMGEYYLGVNLDDSRFKLSFNTTDTTETAFYIRLRLFPHADRWLPIIHHKISTNDGWTFSLTIPSHALIAWNTKDLNWKLYGGVRLTGQDFPVEYAPEKQGWLEGYTGTGLLGVRKHLASILYASLEAGMQYETSTLYDKEGETIYAYKTDPAPWVQLSLETWVITP